ncbi:copper chaperone PCu(A)C [Rhizobium sp. L1K21]|uniref:copper chaperone PCu(A)C n=1 Tax=Rhizobium sp. L1K21 TaxID=2954933 RepID=UPI002092E7FE|nr:copper chaperone PCu(A)C [Rhizobium sp. L1K21]MCO6186740.1 copper chaperone PCu(A)C [Rhizobium sp. L1K21]
MNIFAKIAAAAALAAFAVAPSFAHEFKVGDLEIIHPNVRATVPGAKVGGGFMTISNNGTSDDRLVSVTAPDVSDDVQLHEMTMENDVMKMRQLADGIPLPAGEVTELKPGGLHVMFMNIKHQFKEGEMIKGTLHFEKAGDVDVEFSVGPAAGGEMKHDNMKMGDMKGGKASN